MYASRVHSLSGMFRLIGAGRKLSLVLGFGLCCAQPIATLAGAAPGPSDGSTGPATEIPLPPLDYGPYISRTLPLDDTEMPRGTAYPWRVPPPELPDWQGVRRDTYYFLGLQFAVIGVLYVLPDSISGWDEESREEYSLSRWWDNVTNPVVRDGDQWWINYILHPYWGGTYYIRGRERGLDETQSFLFSTLLSTLYEFGAEALFEPVSVEDLFITPIVGSLVGEYLFTPLRNHVRAKPGELVWTDKALLALTDPLGVVNAGLDRMFGVKSTLTVQPIGTPTFALSAQSDIPGLPPASLRHYEPAWGLQWHMEW